MFCCFVEEEREDRKREERRKKKEERRKKKEERRKKKEERRKKKEERRKKKEERRKKKEERRKKKEEGGFFSSKGFLSKIFCLWCKRERFFEELKRGVKICSLVGRFDLTIFLICFDKSKKDALEKSEKKKKKKGIFFFFFFFLRKRKERCVIRKKRKEFNKLKFVVLNLEKKKTWFPLSR